MTITKIDKTTCRTLREKLEAAVARIEAEHGVVVTIGSGRYSSKNVRFNVEIATCDENGEANTKEAIDFQRNAFSYGMSADDLGRSFESGFKRYTIVGAAVRATKYPILCHCESDGRTYKFPAPSVRSRLAD